MKYARLKAYLKSANEICSIGEAMELQDILVNEFEKEGNEISEKINSIKFFPRYQTASNDIASIERRGQAMRNGMQKMINILNEEYNKEKEKRDNLRFWSSMIVAVISLLLSII